MTYELMKLAVLVLLFYVYCTNSLLLKTVLHINAENTCDIQMTDK